MVRACHTNNILSRNPLTTSRFCFDVLFTRGISLTPALGETLSALPVHQVLSILGATFKLRVFSARRFYIIYHAAQVLWHDKHNAPASDERRWSRFSLKCRVDSGQSFAL